MKTIFLLLLCTVGSLFADKTITAGEFVFTPETPWVIEVSPSHMLKGVAKYGEDGPLVKFYHFGKGQGGGVAANVRRWKRQFEGEVKVTPEELTYGEQKVTVVTMEGTYLAGAMMERKTPKAGYLLLGAIIPHAGGDVFLKMTGPKAEITKAHADFKKLIASAFSAGE